MSFVNHPQILQHDIRKLQQSVVANSKHPHDEEKLEEELNACMKLKYTETELSYLNALLRKKHWQVPATRNYSGIVRGHVTRQDDHFARYDDYSGELRPNHTNAVRPNPRRHLARQQVTGSQVVAGELVDNSTVGIPAHVPDKLAELTTQTLESADLSSKSPLNNGRIHRPPRPSHNGLLHYRPAVQQAISADHSPTLEDFPHNRPRATGHTLPTVASMHPTLPKPRTTLARKITASGVTARMRNYSKHVKEKFVPAVDSSKALAISLRNCSASNFKPLRDIPRMQLFNAKAW